MRSEWREGWRTVVASSVRYGTGLGLVSVTGGLFLKPMQADLGWSAKALSIVPIVGITNVVCLPLAGVLLARFGSRKIGLTGLLLLASGLMVLAAIPAKPAAFYAAVLFLGVVAPLSTTPTFARCISTWFDRHAGAAFGITMNGISFVGLLAVPLTSAAIAAYGWRGGFVALGLTTLLLGVPMLLVWFRERPQPRASTDALFGTTLRDAIRDVRFWLLSGALLLGGVPLGGFLAHLQAMLQEHGIGRVAATSLGLVLTLSITLGRVGGGFLLDRFWDGAVACGLLIASAFGAVMLGNMGIALGLSILTSRFFECGIHACADACETVTKRVSVSRQFVRTVSTRRPSGSS